MIRAVLFDIGGTIHTQRATPETDREYAVKTWSFLKEHGIETEESPEKLMPHIQAGAKIYKAYSEAEKAELPPDRIWSEFMLRDFSIDPKRMEGLGETLCYMFDRDRKEITKREGLYETLEELRGNGFRLGVISNIISRTFVPRILEEYGISDYFETVVTSAECGIRKPDARIFDLALDQMQVKKEEACYIGDTFSRDVQGVRNAAWRLMIQIDNPLTYHRDQEYQDGKIQADYRISNLREICPILKAFNQEQKEGESE